MSDNSAPTYFISDLHLGASQPVIHEAFENFLKVTSQDARAIYILGDLVDAWIGDDDNSAFASRLKKAIKARVNTGTPVYFVHGNRDFLIGDRFSQETGVNLIEENSIVDLYGEKALILHGDTLCADDVAYQNFRKKVRNTAWQKKILRYPLFVRKIIAWNMRRRSSKANSNKADNIMDVCEHAVRASFKQFQVKKMIHGHTHRPARHHYDINGYTCERIVLGDWDTRGWYLKADSRCQQLVHFPINP